MSLDSLLEPLPPLDELETEDEDGDTTFIRFDSDNYRFHVDEEESAEPKSDDFVSHPYTTSQVDYPFEPTVPALDDIEHTELNFTKEDWDWVVGDRFPDPERDYMNIPLEIDMPLSPVASEITSFTDGNSDVDSDEEEDSLKVHAPKRRKILT